MPRPNSYAVFCMTIKTEKIAGGFLDLRLNRKLTKCLIIFFLNDTGPTEIYTLPLHDALPIFGSKHITWNAPGGGFLTAPKQFRHGATSKSRSNTASNSTKHKSP